MSEYRPDQSEETLTKQRPKTKLPRRYKVLMHNDDFTTWDFVVEVLTGIFNQPVDRAHYLTSLIHHKGMAVAGIYTAQLAETKINQTHEKARASGFPLLCTMEPE